MSLKNSIKKIESIIDYTFKNKDLITRSLIHPSFNRIKNKKLKIIENDFERLEFLGDRVLGICIAFLIFKKFKSYNEGDLTKKMSYLVKGDFLYKIALELKLNQFLKYALKSENNRAIKSILSDSVESLIGGIFVDGGYKQVFKQTVEGNWR